MIYILQSEIPNDVVMEVLFDVDQEFRPGKVVLVFTDKKEFIGYLAYYRHDPQTIYIQRTAVVDRRAIFVRHLQELLRWLKAKDPFRYVTGAVQNTNTTLREALRVGFVVHGLRVSTSGQIFVLLIKDVSRG